MSELDALLDGKDKRSKVCAACGAPRTVQVIIRIGRVGSRGVPEKGQSVTMAAQFCDEHGMEAFTTGRKAMGR